MPNPNASSIPDTSIIISVSSLTGPRPSFPARVDRRYLLMSVSGTHLSALDRCRHASVSHLVAADTHLDNRIPICHDFSEVTP